MDTTQERARDRMSRRVISAPLARQARSKVQLFRSLCSFESGFGASAKKRRGLRTDVSFETVPD